MRYLTQSILTAILAAVLFPSAETEGGNLAPNPSFEQGHAGKVAGWAFWGWAPPGANRTAKGVWADDLARTGSRSLKVVNAAVTDVGTWDNGHGGAPIPIEAGTTYTVSVHMRVESLANSLRTNFRFGFMRFDASGKPVYLKSDVTKFGVGAIKTAGEWRKLVAVATAPAGATHLRMDFDLHGKGTAWFDDVAVKEGEDYSGIDPAQWPPKLAVTKFSDPSPASPETPLSVTVRVHAGLLPSDAVVECEVLDYWFRPSLISRPVSVPRLKTQDVEIELDTATRARLFKARHEAGANLFQVNAKLTSNGKVLTKAKARLFRFKNLLKEHALLPPLPERTEHIDVVFGEQKLIDEVRCYDPRDPHPYMEGGRGLSCKSTGGVPQTEWKDIYRETNPSFTSIQTIADRACRVTHGWGWFGYKLNREGLTPGGAYLVVIEYPEDKGRTYNIWNTGIACSMVGGYGFHTGKTLGDHWTRTLNAEYVDYPLSGAYRKWSSYFYLHEKTWAPGDPYRGSSARGNSRDGFWFIVGGVGPSMDALTEGAALRTIKLYEVAEPRSLCLDVEQPPRECGRREIFLTSESNGDLKFDRPEHGTWARQRLHYARFLGATGIAPNRWGFEDELLAVNDQDGLGLKIVPRLMIEREVFGKTGVSEEARAVNARGEPAGLPYPWAIQQLPDILHPETARQVCALLSQCLGPNLRYPQLCGVMFYKHYGAPIQVSFSDYALARFEDETGVRLAGDHAQAKRNDVIQHHKVAYYGWWYAKKRLFLLSVRDMLRALRPDLKLFYFPWHSDDDYPFSCGRLRYSGQPMDDKVYVPGTNILLVPSFTVPPEEWSEEQKKRPALARNYYRERISPALANRLSTEDLLYGRHRDMKELWGAARSGELPHLRYPEEMDLVSMFTEPGSVYASGVGCNPRLYRRDDGIVYWAPVHYKYTADNTEFLDLFRTGEGVAVANHFPYNEETGHANTYSLHCALGVEHAGPFCMMEEVLAMANVDPAYVMMSMWEPLKRGFPKYAREFAAAYRALPTVPSQVLDGAVEPGDRDIVVRSYATDYGTYFAVINSAFDLATKKIAVTVDPGFQHISSVRDLVTDGTIAFERVQGGNVRLALVMRPMELKSLRMVPRTPPVALRNVALSRLAFSPNGDGRGDTVTVTATTVMQVTGGDWSAEIRTAQGQVVRRYGDKLPNVRFTWDGRSGTGGKCSDGEYSVVLEASQYPGRGISKTIILDTAPPTSVPVEVGGPADLSVNWYTLRGTVGAGTGKVTLSVWPGDQAEMRTPLMLDGTFEVNLEGLSIGENRVELHLEDEAGNRAVARTLRLDFALPRSRPISFDFGAGPIMDGFSAIRNETRYTDRRGYGWIKYDNTWKGDRGKGDDLLRDYCSGKEDREWAVRLPNGSYRVTVAMVDTCFDHYSPDIYVEGQKHVTHRRIPKNQPFRPAFEVTLRDGVMNFVLDNPGHLPYFALNGIVIEPRP